MVIELGYIQVVWRYKGVQINVYLGEARWTGVRDGGTGKWDRPDRQWRLGTHPLYPGRTFK